MKTLIMRIECWREVEALLERCLGGVVQTTGIQQYREGEASQNRLLEDGIAEDRSWVLVQEMREILKILKIWISVMMTKTRILRYHLAEVGQEEVVGGPEPHGLETTTAWISEEHQGMHTQTTRVTVALSGVGMTHGHPEAEVVAVEAAEVHLVAEVDEVEAVVVVVAGDRTKALPPVEVAVEVVAVAVAAAEVEAEGAAVAEVVSEAAGGRILS